MIDLLNNIPRDSLCKIGSDKSKKFSIYLLYMYDFLSGYSDADDIR